MSLESHLGAKNFELGNQWLTNFTFFACELKIGIAFLQLLQ